MTARTWLSWFAVLAGMGLAVLVLAPGERAQAQGSGVSCGEHGHVGYSERKGEEIINHCSCDAGYDRVDDQCMPQKQVLTVWIKSFIPNRHLTNPGFIRPVPNRPGKTMIPGPNIPYTDISVPFVGRACYNTNNRGFSSDIHAEAKITSLVTVTIEAGRVGHVDYSAPILDSTEEYDCRTGRITCTRTASPEAITVSQPLVVGTVIKFAMDGEGSNPCVSAPAAITPSIKYHATVTIDPVAKTINFTGVLANFPSYEAYVSVSGKNPVTILQETPTPGSTAWALIFTRAVNKTVRYR